MSLKSRINRVKLRVDRPSCDCDMAKIEIVYHHPVDSPIIPPEKYCPRCGRGITRIVVQYVDTVIMGKPLEHLAQGTVTLCPRR
jgi:hypothetical protein